MTTIAWLDASREEQRKIREVVNLFSQSESRDELGIGQVRDALSDLLFPGTSTLHTRARYLLLIPWCYQAAAKRATDGADLAARAATNERRLIIALNDAGAHDGLIGRIALAKLKTLPSSLYGSGLEKWNIRVGDVADELAARVWTHEAEEIVERRPRMWDVLPMPSEFPQSADRLDLSHGEAVWVREKILSGSQGSLLAELLTEIDREHHRLSYAWDVPIDGRIGEVLAHARRLSLVIEGAALSYNLALARRYEAQALTSVKDPVATYEGRVTSWNEDFSDDAIANWNLPDLWSTVLELNPRITTGTRTFIEAWVDLLQQGRRPNSAEAVDLVVSRERRQKGAQSRLVNDKLLRAWSGESGTGRLAFRWPNVTRILTDIKTGLDSAAA